jgi:superfamily II DNA or RNA helicase
MRPGDRVRRPSTGEIGVVISIAGDFADVGIGDQTVFVHLEELEPLTAGPLDLLPAGMLGSTEAYQLRLRGLYLRHAYRFDEMSGLSNARIEPALHQVFIAHRVNRKLYPRMILADEVGLGKTIEAGLVIKELRARELIDRVLIVCPANLQLQWKQELSSKFNEDFEILDGSAIKFLGKGGENPWSKRDNVITSLPFVANRNRSEKVVEAGWDLVVFDEAHRVRRSLLSGKKVKATLAYELADDLKEIASGLLLLTATPMQLHPFELYSLIELVEPGLYPGFDVYEAHRKTLPALNDLARALVGWGALKAHEKDHVVNHHGSLLRAVGLSDATAGESLDDERRRNEVLDALAERHPLAGVLVRNRKSQVLEGAAKRTARSFLVETTAEEQDLYEDVAAYLRDVYDSAEAAKNNAIGFLMVTYHKMLTSSASAIHHSLKKRLTKLRDQHKKQQEVRAKLSPATVEELRESEELSAALESVEDEAVDLEVLAWEMAQLEALVSRLGKTRDTKALKLLETLHQIFKEHADEQVIIFTQFVQTQLFLQTALEANGYTVNIFNGSMSLEAKEESVKEFRERGQILISTEAGGEGRNFQFCHLMVNYDLPWNPMKVEQRIGRLDRIGQKKDIFIYNLACAGTVEERVLAVLEERIGLFEESVGSLDPILGEVEAEIERIVMADVATFGRRFASYETDVEKKVLEAKAKEQAWADLALDRSSFRKDAAEELLERSPLARWSDLQSYISEVLSYRGGTVNDHDQGGEVISLSARLKSEIGSREGVIRGTFDPETARIREDLPFFAFGHETIDRLLSLGVHGQPDATAARRLRGAPPGVAVEVFYELVVGGLQPKGRMIRHLVTQGGEVSSEDIQHVPPSGEPVYDVVLPDWVGNAVRSSRLEFEKVQALEREEARRSHDAVKAAEQERAGRVYEYRRARLQRIIEDQRAWIAEKEKSGSERDRKVLPARKGGLRKNEERLADLGASYERQLFDIQAKKPAVSGHVLAAGLVIGDG